MAERRRALVIGGSVGGLFAAGLLRQAGWDAIVFERSRDDLAGRGAGIGVTRELLDTMQRVGVKLDPTIAVATPERIWLAADGEIRFRQHRDSLGSAWGRVYRPLRDAYPDAHYRTGAALVRVEQDEDSVTAVFENGARETGDLLVAADGNLSTVRAQFAPEVAPVYAGYVAWRSIIPAASVPRSTLDMIFRRIVYSFAARDMMLTMMVPGAGDDPAADHRRIYAIWYRPTRSEEDFRAHFTDADGRHHGVSIPPPLIRPELIAEVKEEAGALFAPAVADAIRAAPQLLLQAISDLESQQLAFGRVAIMGDAAFVARPHVAAGITKAALDATRLADSLAHHSDDVPAALAEYETAQLDFGRRIVAHGRRLGSYVETADGAARLGDPEKIILEYGAPHLVHDADAALLGAGVGGVDRQAV